MPDFKNLVRGAELVAWGYRWADAEEGANPLDFAPPEWLVGKVTTWRRGNLQVIFVEDGAALRVIVPGTNALDDWTGANLRFRSVRYSGAKWHGGFWRGGVALAARISGHLAWLDTVYRDARMWTRTQCSRRVEIYGHSMGGGVGNAAAIILQRNAEESPGRWVRDVRVVAYDPPRICADRQALEVADAVLRGHATRVCCSGSIVARVPPRFFGFGWEHVPAEVVHMDGDGGWTDREATAWEWVRCVFRNLRRRGIQLVEEHGIATIERELREVAATECEFWNDAKKAMAKLGEEVARNISIGYAPWPEETKK